MWFYGANARLGYILPIRKADLQWTLYAGGYYFGMLVPAKAYGVAYLFQPSVGVDMRWAKPNHRPLSVYVKYGFLFGQGFAVAATNFEISLGLRYQLNPASAKYPINFTFDASRFQGATATGSDSFTLTLFTFGTQFVF
jgi:hypothetical protein